MMKTMFSLVMMAIAAALPLQASAHHSMAEWDRSTIDEMEGEIVNVVWRNPHIRWTMKISNDEGEEDRASMARSLQRICQVRNRVREFRSLGSVRGGAQQCPRLLGRCGARVGQADCGYRHPRGYIHKDI